LRADLAREKQTAKDWEQAVLLAGFTCPVLDRARNTSVEHTEAVKVDQTDARCARMKVCVRSA
jgi:hypothetical protein